jgi:hypothetical protein
MMHGAAKLLLALLCGSVTSFHAPLSGVSRVGSTSTSVARTSPIRAGDDVEDWGVDNLFEMMEDADEKISGLDSFMATVKKEPSCTSATERGTC